MEEDIEQTMDRFFGGVLRSDVVCACCGYTSTAHDPFKDISVDILEPPTPKVQPPAVDVPKPNPVSASKGSKSAGKTANGKQCSAVLHSFITTDHVLVVKCAGHCLKVYPI